MSYIHFQTKAILDKTVRVKNNMAINYDDLIEIKRWRAECRDICLNLLRSKQFEHFNCWDRTIDWAKGKEFKDISNEHSYFWNRQLTAVNNLTAEQLEHIDKGVKHFTFLLMKLQYEALTVLAKCRKLYFDMANKKPLNNIDDRYSTKIGKFKFYITNDIPWKLDFIHELSLNMMPLKSHNILKKEKFMLESYLTHREAYEKSKTWLDFDDYCFKIYKQLSIRLNT